MVLAADPVSLTGMFSILMKILVGTLLKPANIGNVIMARYCTLVSLIYGC